MRSLALVNVLCILLLLGTSSAWPWRPYGLKLAPNLERRQDANAANSASAAAGPSSDHTKATATASKGAKTTDTKTSVTSTGKITDTAKGSSSTSTTTSISVDPRLPAGGISMINPGPYITTYYKIGQKVTFAWNYTSLSVTPSGVNVVASCSLNDATYTLTSNMSVKQTGSVTWDTGEYQATATVPLLTATYTLIVYDESHPIDYVAPAGYLGTDNQLQFGMYLPQPYIPLNEYQCATCNSALSDIDRNAIKFALAMATITLASFVWFAGDFGVFST